LTIDRFRVFISQKEEERGKKAEALGVRERVKRRKREPEGRREREYTASFVNHSYFMFNEVDLLVREC
jgi:hypothetical protein